MDIFCFEGRSMLPIVPFNLYLSPRSSNVHCERNIYAHSEINRYVHCAINRRESCNTVSRYVHCAISMWCI